MDLGLSAPCAERAALRREGLAGPAVAGFASRPGRAAENAFYVSFALDVVAEHLRAQGIAVSAGTIVDATIIAAPSSTKNATGTRDPGMHQTQKGRQWY